MPWPRRCTLRAPTGAVAILVAALAAGASGCSGDDPGATPGSTGTRPPDTSPPTTEAPLEAGEQLYVYVPEVGDCFDRRVLGEEQGGEEIVLRLDCDLPHQYEVFALRTIDPAAVPTTTTTSTRPPSTTTTDPDEEHDGRSGAVTSSTSSTTTSTTVTPSELWPGDDALARVAQLVCPKAFDPWAGIPYELSSLEIGWMLPDESTWSNGKRVVTCTVYDPTGTPDEPVRLVGSMAGAGR